MDLKTTSDTIIELFKNGIMSEDYEMDSEETDTVTEIKLRSKEDGKQFHVLILETLPDKDGGES